MIIDTDIKIGNRRVVATKVASRPRPTVTNLSGDAMRYHEQIVEYRHRVNTLSADLESATQALAAANAEIARLYNEITELATTYDKQMKQLRAQLQSAENKVKSEKSEKSGKKKGKKSSSDPKVAEVAEVSEAAATAETAEGLPEV